MLDKQAHSQSQHEYSFLSIDCDTQLAADPSVKAEPVSDDRFSDWKESRGIL